ncbi:MPND protein, partial [Regulus satrapa]|nr:MPND protein [Regulus satrapa]
KAAGGARGAVLTRRGITLRVLLRDGLLEPGRGVLSIYYLGKKFVGDLGSDGTITWQETGQVFNSPSAWATHCKRLVNPAKKSGCGWASVRYKGQKLDQYKAAWLRKHQPNVPPPEEVGQGSPPPGTPRGAGEPGASPVCPQSLASEGEEEELPEDEEEEAAREGRVPVPEPVAPKKPEERSKKQQGKSVAEPAGTGRGHGDPGAQRGRGRRWQRGCGSSRNPQTLVEVTSFAAINKFQPFNVAISSNVLLLLVRPLPRLGHRWWHWGHLQPAGWGWGCRPPPVPAPSVPTGPFYHGNPGVESKIAPFWVMPPPEQRPNDYGIPMDVEVTYIQDGFLTNDVVQEMTLLVEFYKGAPDLVKFQELWSQDQTYLDKLKGSLASRTPKDQSFSHVLEQIFSLLKLSG